MSDNAADWTIPGSNDQSIIGNAHLPQGPARGVVLIVHGFLGYKDYGMFPFLANQLAEAGYLTHRFNLSHSGMTNRHETFERPDLFEKDTWSRQVRDINAVIDAVAGGELPGKGLPYMLLGHSRGGVSVLLAAGRRFQENAEPLPAAVVTVAAPDRACSMSPEAQAEMIERGFVEVVSNRTGQAMRLDAAWLKEQLADPEAHDVPAHATACRCPLLFIHGGSDPTVDPGCAQRLAEAAGEEARALIVDDADHVFNTPNPMTGPPSPQLKALIDAIIDQCEKGSKAVS